MEPKTEKLRKAIRDAELEGMQVSRIYSSGDDKICCDVRFPDSNQTDFILIMDEDSHDITVSELSSGQKWVYDGWELVLRQYEIDNLSIER